MSDKKPAKESKVSESLHSPDEAQNGKDGLHETQDAKHDSAHGLHETMGEAQTSDEDKKAEVDGAAPDTIDHSVLPPDAHNGGGGSIPNDTSGGNPASKAALGNVGQSHPDAQDALAEHARNILADSKMQQAAQDPALIAQQAAEDDEDEDEDGDDAEDEKPKKAKKSAKK